MGPTGPVRVRAEEGHFTRKQPVQRIVFTLFTRPLLKVRSNYHTSWPHRTHPYRHTSWNTSRARWSSERFGRFCSGSAASQVLVDGGSACQSIGSMTGSRDSMSAGVASLVAGTMRRDEPVGGGRLIGPSWHICVKSNLDCTETSQVTCVSTRGQ